MRDAERIEAQMSESEQSVEASSEQSGGNASVRTGTEQAHAESRGDRIAPWRWKPGKSGNPNGRPRHDWASFIAQKAFENNPELIYKGLVHSLSRGSGFVFQVASDRAYGKLKERIEISGTLELGTRLEKARKRRAEKVPVLKANGDEK